MWGLIFYLTMASKVESYGEKSAIVNQNCIDFHSTNTPLMFKSREHMYERFGKKQELSSARLADVSFRKR